MSAENRERVIRLLETYHEREQKIALLNYELLHFPRASPNEVAEGMGLGHSCELTPHSGYISDKTFFISLNYQERASQINAETINDILGELGELGEDQNRLEYYVSILAPQQETVIRRFYFERHTWEEIAKEVKVALRTVHKIKNRAFDQLAEFYDICHSFR